MWLYSDWELHNITLAIKEEPFGQVSVNKWAYIDYVS